MFISLNLRALRKVPRGNILFIFFLLAAGGLLMLRCAGQIPPPGGSLDTDPPAVIRTSPDSNAVRVRPDAISLEFNEYVDRRTVEESIFISPYVGTLEFDWSGTEVSIRFSEQLRDHTTYVVNLGTDVVDRRAGNRMGRAFTLAFSTGDSIDGGIISGRIVDEKPEGVMIFAYVLDGIDPDTLNPEKIRPDYITQSGTGGVFSLTNLRSATYRVIAVRDEFKDLIYGREVDQYGVLPEDVRLQTDGIQTDRYMRLTRDDTTRPFLTSAVAFNSFHVIAKFSEPIDTIRQDQTMVILSDTLGGSELRVRLMYNHASAPALSGILLQTPMDSSKVYRLSVSGIQDRKGNTIDAANASFVFHGSSSPDSIRPWVMSPTVTDSARGVAPDDPLVLMFSEPVQRDPAASAVMLRGTSGDQIGATLKWDGDLHLKVLPRIKLRGGEWYTLSVRLDSVVDYAGNSFRDSVYQLRFETLDPRTTGKIDGTVLDDRKDETGPMVVSARSVDMSRKNDRIVTVPGPGRFVLENMPEGLYVLSAFRDTDGSGTYTSGLPFPFVPSERFTFSPDTVKVRARWGVEGILLRIR